METYRSTVLSTVYTEKHKISRPNWQINSTWSKKTLKTTEMNCTGPTVEITTWSLLIKLVNAKFPQNLALTKN